jgi:hypothetical protein
MLIEFHHGLIRPSGLVSPFFLSAELSSRFAQRLPIACLESSSGAIRAAASLAPALHPPGASWSVADNFNSPRRSLRNIVVGWRPARRSRAQAHHVSAGYWNRPFSDCTRIMVGLRSLVRTVQFASIRAAQCASWSVADNFNTHGRSLRNIVVGWRPARRTPCAGPPRFGGLLEPPVSRLHPHRGGPALAGPHPTICTLFRSGQFQYARSVIAEHRRRVATSTAHAVRRPTTFRRAIGTARFRISPASWWACARCARWSAPYNLRASAPYKLRAGP